ncbi:hypothetical protein IC235_02095 [Hymenobacter sp. BT664]|uniref:Uncharacterized protein n=1 Tax=Hymenobacter montanus TaxID=2771359 RepID=A0A927BAE1_9BACT|nr:hypothetical protein [Hymenobacter montanus]MBD2766680.1 hypothetical protein [Hymenobacter montanus]
MPCHSGKRAGPKLAVVAAKLSDRLAHFIYINLLFKRVNGKSLTTYTIARSSYFFSRVSHSLGLLIAAALLLGACEQAATKGPGNVEAPHHKTVTNNRGQPTQRDSATKGPANLAPGNPPLVTATIERPARRDSLIILPLEASTRFGRLYPVYQFSPQTAAIVIDELGDEASDYNAVTDSFFSGGKAFSNKYTVADTNGITSLYSTPFLTQKYGDMIGKSFYVIGTTGAAMASVKDVACHIDECNPPMIVLLLNVKPLAICGIPLFAASSRIALQQGPFTMQEGRYDKLNASINRHYRSEQDYAHLDNGQVTIVGNAGDYYFGYRDSPKAWVKNIADHGGITFPYRIIYKPDQGGRDTVWQHLVDHFGMACD